ncbi:MAG: hypothetical protein RXS42_08820, partial [Nitrososphaeria archaeon]
HARAAASFSSRSPVHFSSGGASTGHLVHIAHEIGQDPIEDLIVRAIRTAAYVARVERISAGRC